MEASILAEIEVGKTIEFQVGDSVAESIPPQTTPKSIKIIENQ